MPSISTDDLVCILRWRPLCPSGNRVVWRFVHAAGSPDPTRSHFDGQDNIESGTPGNKATPDGWLNRLEGVLPAGGDALCADAGDQCWRTPAKIFKGHNRVTTIASGATAATADGA